MNATPAPANGRQAAYTITAGLDLLADWADSATAAEQNIVYRILFTVADHTAAAQYNTLLDPASPAEFFVMGKAGLVVKIRVETPDSFAITYIGTSDTAPGLDASCAAAAAQALHAIHASTPQA
jgi:Family of unknown function (DUF6235)